MIYLLQIHTLVCCYISQAQKGYLITYDKSEINVSLGCKESEISLRLHQFKIRLLLTSAFEKEAKISNEIKCLVRCRINENLP